MMKALFGATFGPDWPGERCGARCKRSGKPCQSPAMPNGRCRMHGGKSTGPRTLEGLNRMRCANTRHGAYAGPNHPHFGEPAGPFWVGHRQARRQARAAIAFLKSAALPEVRECWKDAGRRFASPGRSLPPRDPKTGRFRRPFTADEMASFVFRDENET